MSTIGLTSACPQCAAPISFGGAHSIVCVCSYCHSLIARTDRSVEDLGKVPDLVAIDTRLALGDHGRMQELTFQVLGRLQLHQGVASWNEWYVAWNDGSYGWLAEAAGRVIVSRRLDQPQPLPNFMSLQVGERVQLPGVGNMVIEELGEATVLSAEGELPSVPQLQHVYRFADGSLAGGLYATIHYENEDEAPEVFVGRELSYEAAGLTGTGEARAWQAKQTSGVALRCPGCSAPISLKLSTSVSVVCPQCHKLWSHEQGELQLVTGLKSRNPPALPLGARGTLSGRELEVIGWTQRVVTVDGTDYKWGEYLLHGSNGYSFLSENKGHWVHFSMLPAAAVVCEGQIAAYHRDRKYAHFQASKDVRYIDVQGEFYWEIKPEHRAQMDDYVCPPYQLSVEYTKNEQIWTHGEYLAADSVWKAFGQTKQLPSQTGVAPCQPNPHAERLRRWSLGIGLGIALFVLFTVALLIAQPRRVRHVQDVAVGDDQPVTLSEPFNLIGGVQTAAISARAEFDSNGWVAIDVALIQEQTGQSRELDMELSLFSGYDGGESWVEDDRSVEKRLGSVAPGSYVLRVEPQYNAAYARPRSLRIEVSQGAYLWLPLWLCILGLGLPPLWVWMRKSNFEARRWSESDHASGGE